jgi:hypothetical protein
MRNKNLTTDIYRYLYMYLWETVDMDSSMYVYHITRASTVMIDPDMIKDFLNIPE